MKFFLPFVAAFLLTFSPSALQAQTAPKMGHVNIQKLLQSMPGYKAAEKKLQEFAKQLQDTYGSMEAEYQKKIQDYYAQEASMIPAIKEVKQKEILDLERRMETLQANSQKQLVDKEVELLTPIEDRIMAAIKDVAREKGFSYIFDTSGGSLLYYPETDDITNLLKPKLGIQ